MLVINLFGGPGAGKSTTASGVFHLLKTRDQKAEYVQEFAKDVVWDQSYKILEDQFFLTANQNRRLYRLKGHNLDYAIVDSPLLLGLVYKNENYFKNYEPLVLEMFNSYNNLNIFLNRTKKYQQYGRQQTEDEAIIIDEKIKNMLRGYNIDFIEMDGDVDAPHKVLKELGL